MPRRQSTRLLLLPVVLATIGCFEKTGPVLGPPTNLPLPDPVGPVPSSAHRILKQISAAGSEPAMPGPSLE